MNRKADALTAQVSFTLRGRNPDVLTCIANLSNDEAFTPPEFANRVLDTLAEAWAAANNAPSCRSKKRCWRSSTILTAHRARNGQQISRRCKIWKRRNAG